MVSPSIAPSAPTPCTPSAAVGGLVDLASHRAFGATTVARIASELARSPQKCFFPTSLPSRTRARPIDDAESRLFTQGVASLVSHLHP